jgi:agmatine deiminase
MPSPLRSVWSKWPLTTPGSSDCGPTFVKNDKVDVRAVDWDFNAWGGLVDGLYFPLGYGPDGSAEGLAKLRASTPTALRVFVLEGAQFTQTGEGTLITPRNVPFE